MKNKILTALLSASLCASLTIQAEQVTKVNSNIDALYYNNQPAKVVLPYETDEDFQARMQWWQDAKYGMFIHWGLYSILGGEYLGETSPGLAEWIQKRMNIPLADYKKLVSQFNPVEFDADKWVMLAKNAGMKYIVLTAKHHDGFALFDSAVSDYDMMQTPYNKDIVAALKKAAHKQGMKFGLYYSHNIDWEDPNAYIGEGELAKRMNLVDYKSENMDRKKYIDEKALPQLTEMLTHYGEIDILWFDMGSGLSNDEVRTFVKTARDLQPNIIISSRVGKEDMPPLLAREMQFDFFTPSDNYFTGDELSMPWEMAGTTNTSWGYRTGDDHWRSPKFILSSLVSTTSRGGNYLLNVGPDGNGHIAKPIEDNLLEAGQWLKRNGEAIYTSQRSPFPWNYEWGYVTQKPGTLYLNVFNWPEDNKIEINGLLNKVTGISGLVNQQAVSYQQNDASISIDLSQLKATSLATTLALHYDNDLKVDKQITASSNDRIRLDRIAGTYSKDLLLSQWKFTVKKPGTYDIALVSNEKKRHENPQWVGADQKGSIQVAGKIIPFELKRDSEIINPTLFFYKSITSQLGEVTFEKAGTYTLFLKNMEIGAGKWTSGLALDYINLILESDK